ncbi:hypothetical protein QBC43DRAFT_306154 [Cladorrhinum sp. PSN259]|nr:hypothetical protein QBC43DRAFT_306154 [Cladorrhinum sp. PSN259]
MFSALLLLLLPCPYPFLIILLLICFCSSSSSRQFLLRIVTSNGKRGSLSFTTTFLLLRSGIYRNSLVSNHWFLHILLCQSGTMDKRRLPLTNCSSFFFIHIRMSAPFTQRHL